MRRGCRGGSLCCISSDNGGNPVETPILGRLITVQPRDVWVHEAHHFTPWLLANVDVLSDLLGMELELQVAEHPVGGFSLDLLGQTYPTTVS